MQPQLIDGLHGEEVRDKTWVHIVLLQDTDLLLLLMMIVLTLNTDIFFLIEINQVVQVSVGTTHAVAIGKGGE